MLEHFLKVRVAETTDTEHRNRITEALSAAGIAYTCKTKDVNCRNAFDQSRMGTMGVRPKYVTEIYVDRQDADAARNVLCVVKQNQGMGC